MNPFKRWLKKPSTAEDWGAGKLGVDPDYAELAPEDLQEKVDAALGDTVYFDHPQFNSRTEVGKNKDAPDVRHGQAISGNATIGGGYHTLGESDEAADPGVSGQGRDPLLGDEP